MLSPRCIFPQAISPWQKAACVGIGLGSMGATAGLVYYNRQSFVDGWEWSKREIFAPPSTWTAKHLEEVLKSIKDAMPEGEPEDDKKKEASLFRKTTRTLGDVVSWPFDAFFTFSISREGIKSPLSLGGDLVLAGIGFALAFYSAKGLWAAGKLYRSFLMKSTECCLIARSTLLLPLVIGPCGVLIYGGGTIAYFAWLRGLVTVNRLSEKDAEVDWMAVLPPLDRQDRSYRSF